MIEVAVVSVLACAVAIAAYLERKSLKADVTAAEAKVLTVAGKLIAELQLKESAVRVKVSADVAKVIADAKYCAELLDADALKIKAIAEAEAIKAEDVLFIESAKVGTWVSSLITKIEADLKKVL
jgi:hypothetical protein